MLDMIITWLLIITTLYFLKVMWFPSDIWRPIASAPRDGKRIILGGWRTYPKDGKVFKAWVVVVASWGLTSWETQSAAAWIDDESQRINQQGIEYTHWRECPKKPADL